MKHKWVEEEKDGGHVGWYDYWLCEVCGAQGGLCIAPETGPWHGPYIILKTKPDYYYTLQLTDDCEESQKMIESAKGEVYGS